MQFPLLCKEGQGRWRFYLASGIWYLVSVYSMVQYSHSRLSTFEQCPLRFKYQYIDKIKREEDSIEAFMGNHSEVVTKGSAISAPPSDSVYHPPVPACSAISEH